MRILLVDDEPAALRHLQTVVEFTGVQCEVVGTAENGAQAIELVDRLMPDVVITDMKMPVIDGIAFALMLKDNHPHVLTAVVSGYQEFEYLQGAIKSGVADYLLKPVGIEQMKSLLMAFSEKVASSYNAKRLTILNELRLGAVVSESDLSKYFHSGNIYAVILRRGGIVSRLSPRDRNDEVVPIYIEGYLNLHGRDENEAIIVAFEQPVLVGYNSWSGAYSTIVRLDSPIDIRDFSGVCKLLYAALESFIVIGQSMDVCISPVDKLPPVCDYEFDNLARVEHYMSSAQNEKLKHALVDSFAQWEKEARPAIWVESALNRLFSISLKHASPQNSENVFYAIQEAVLSTQSCGELMAAVWALLERVLQIPEIKPQRIDSQLFFERIKKHIETNFAEPLSIQTICSMFGISQTYANKLFRKYSDATFTEFLTRHRMEKAKEYLVQRPKIPVKDVAQMVGYSDQFYFSKVFRLATGIPPSEYKC